jgi:hypothetical protein
MGPLGPMMTPTWVRIQREMLAEEVPATDPDHAKIYGTDVDGVSEAGRIKVLSMLEQVHSILEMTNGPSVDEALGLIDDITTMLHKGA